MIRKIRRILSIPRVHRFCAVMALVSTCFTFSLLFAGCATPVWLADATNLIPVIATSAGSVLLFLAGITGNAEFDPIIAEITTWSTNVENGLLEIEKLVNEYKTTPTEDTLQKILGFVTLIDGDLSNILGMVGLPAAIASKIQAFAVLIQQELTSWSSLLPAFGATQGAKFTVTVPMTKKQYEVAFDALLNSPTGDEKADAVLARMKRFA